MPASRPERALDLFITNVEYTVQESGPFDTYRSAFGINGCLPRVPVIRAYGATRHGQRCCLHVHNVFPYLYVEYHGSLEPTNGTFQMRGFADPDVVLDYIDELGHAVQTAIAASLRLPPTRKHFLAAIHLCKGTPFYGYHVRPAYYLKISYVDPAIRHRLRALLEQGHVLNTVFQPYEAHVQYHLQWMMDYNVYGCDWMHVESVSYRSSADKAVPQDSYCAVEADTWAHSIKNRRYIHPSEPGGSQPSLNVQEDLVVPSLRALWSQDRERRAYWDLGPTPPSAMDERERRGRLQAAYMQWDASPRLNAAWHERVGRAYRDHHDVAIHELDKYVLAAYQTVELFHENGYDHVGWEDESGRSAKMFDYAQSQTRSVMGTTRATPIPEPTLPPSFSSHETSDIVPSTFPNESPMPVPVSQTDRLPQRSPAPPLALVALAAPPMQLPTCMPRSLYTYKVPPPTQVQLEDSWSQFQQPRVLYETCHYSSTADVPRQAHEYGGQVKTLPSTGLDGLDGFRGSTSSRVARGLSQIRYWQWAHAPPSQVDVQAWLTMQDTKEQGDEQKRHYKRQARNADLLAERAKRADQAVSWQHEPSLSDPSRRSCDGRSPPLEKKHLSTLCMDLLVCTRGDLGPDSMRDPISAVVYTWMDEAQSDVDFKHAEHGMHHNSDADGHACDWQQEAGHASRSGIILVRDSGLPIKLGLREPITVVDSEVALFHKLVDLVRMWDPDILAGYDVARTSWGFLVRRASAVPALDMDIVYELGRMRTQSAVGAMTDWSASTTSSLRICGRHVLNVWRLMRTHIALTQYTLEHVVMNVLHKRTPVYSCATLTEWLRSYRAADVARALRYALRRVRFCVALLDKTEMITRTAEFARMYGVDFFSVLSRGSQFRVESVLLRITKPRSYVLPSPNRAQVAQQNAPECLPLVLEPCSGMYRGPVVVLDFQSLYPTMMMAYNLCYSTCVGRVTPFKGSYKLGFTQHAELPPRTAAAPVASPATAWQQQSQEQQQQDTNVYILPNGLAFVRPHIREGILPRMLHEVLSARIMTKHTLKRLPKEAGHVPQRRLQAQQLALKLLANVTYGYCGATASGRMPCVEIADAIVQSARETLEKAMALIEQTPEWGADIVYGDTDSIFVHLPGQSKDDAFRIGHEIAERITAMNPAPVRLNFEKVYLPCMLVAKKRYAGYRFDTKEQARATLDVKGLEMIRRDGHVALQRMQETCLRILFETHDMTAMKRYCQRQWAKLYTNDVLPLYLLMSKEVRMGTYASGASMPPGAAVAMQRMRHDPAYMPHAAERVPYLIQHGAPSAKLQDLALSPHELLRVWPLALHMEYYVRRTILPALDRLLGLVGVNVYAWLEDMPKQVGRPRRPLLCLPPTRPNAPTLLQTLAHTCLVCGNPGTSQAHPFCIDCLRNPETSMQRITSAQHAAETQQLGLHHICTTCAQEMERPPCEAIDCAVLYKRISNDRLVQHLHALPGDLERDLEQTRPGSDAWTW